MRDTLLRYTILSFVVLATGMTAFGQGVKHSKGLLLISDFNDSIQNRLDGYYNKFEQSPSSASTFLVDFPRRGGSGRSLRIKVDRRDEGFCGVWLHLFNFRDLETRKYFDARGYKYLSFWVRGKKGGEKFTIKLADKKWIELEDGYPVGPAAKFMAGRVSSYWKEVLIPLKKLDRIDLSQLGGITLDFDSMGQHTIYIDDIAFKKKRWMMTPVARISDQPETRVLQYPRAMWVWTTRELIKTPGASQELFKFCQQENINQLWVQVLYHFEPRVDLSQVPTAGGVPDGLRCVLEQVEGVRQFLSQAHEYGISVHALDGYPEFAQKIYHPLPLSIVDAIIQFNKQSEPSQRYDGIHFDNEPYLITGSRDRDRNQQILEEFLQLNEECQRRVSEQSDMVYGIDIPFFWHETDLQTHQAIGQVQYGGHVKSASYHCIDMLDNVGIMNYRDTADGADGMIVHGQQLLAYGDKAKRAKIYMGVETFSYKARECWFAVGLPRSKFNRVINAKGYALSQLSRLNGFRKQMFDDGANIHVGIELPARPTEQENQRAQETMVLLARRFGASCDPALRDNVGRLTLAARKGFISDVEWSGPLEKFIIDPETSQAYAGMVATRVMLSKVTFAQESYQDIISQINAAESFFGRSKSYAGIAIHYYKTFRAKVQAAKESSR